MEAYGFGYEPKHDVGEYPPFGYEEGATEEYSPYPYGYEGKDRERGFPFNGYHDGPQKEFGDRRPDFGYPQHGKGFGKGFGKGYGKGYDRFQGKGFGKGYGLEEPHFEGREGYGGPAKREYPEHQMDAGAPEHWRNRRLNQADAREQYMRDSPRHPDFVPQFPREPLGPKSHSASPEYPSEYAVNRAPEGPHWEHSPHSQEWSPMYHRREYYPRDHPRDFHHKWDHPRDYHPGQYGSRYPNYPEYGRPNVEDVRAELSNQVANPFKSQPVNNEKDNVSKKVQGILNRITPEKYDTLSQQLLEVIGPHMAEESDMALDVCKEVSAKIFEKAIGEPQNSTLYADLVQLMHVTQQRVTRDVRANGRPTAAASIRTLILNRCQKQFYSVSEPREDPAEAEALHDKHRKRCQGNARLVAEVYLRKLLPALIMEEVIKFLAKDESTVPFADRMEVLVTLLSVAGPQIDWNRPVMTECWNQVHERSVSDLVPVRIRFLLQDLINLRSSDWAPARPEVDSPKKLAEFHRPMTCPSVDAAMWHNPHMYGHVQACY